MHSNSSILKVVQAKLPIGETEVDRWIVTRNQVPIFTINNWLDMHSVNSVLTGKAYAYSLVKFLRFLDLIEVQYHDVQKKHINAYIKHLLYSIEGNSLYVMIPEITLNTVSRDISAVVNFYQWLESHYDGVNPSHHLSVPIKGNKRKLKAKNIWQEVWGFDFHKIIKAETKKIKKKANYHKWYTEEEKECLATNFLKLRDKSIFLITLEGCRIDEVLNIEYHNYNSYERTIQITVSKTHGRLIVLPQSSCDVIDRYIATERTEVESTKGIIDWLFINLRPGETQGDRLTYRSYYEILKRCAKRAGFDPKTIIPHNGRSTKAQELIEHQVLYPEDGISDVFIAEQMGWGSLNSSQPYKKQVSIKIQKKTAEKINNRKRMDVNLNGD